MQNDINAYNTYEFNQFFDSKFDEKLEEQKLFGYSLTSNFGNVFKSHTNISGNVISHGLVPYASGGLYAGLGSNWRFVLPRNNGYLAQLFIKTRVRSDIDISNILYSGSLVFREIVLRNEDTYIIEKSNPHYEYARSEVKANNSVASDKIEAMISYTEVGNNLYEVVTSPNFHCFEAPSVMLNSNYLRQMYLDLSVANTIEQMGISVAVPPSSFSIESIEVVGVYYVLYRSIRSLDQPLYQLSVQHTAEKPRVVDHVNENRILIPIECTKGPFELILQITNDRFKFVQISDFRIYENNRPIINVDRKLNYITSDGTFNSTVGSMVYNFGFNNSRIEKSGMLPLNNDKTYALEVFYIPRPDDGTEYKLHVNWSYFEPRIISTNGLITNFDVL